MFCKNCGSQINEGASFCNNCGTPVKNQNNTATQQSTPVQQPVNQVNNVPPVQQQIPPMNNNQSYGYQQPNNMPPANEKKPIGLAVASMVLGICSLIFYCIWFIALPTAIIGVILSILSLKNPQNGGRGMAIAGLVTSIIALVLAVIILIAYINGAANYRFGYNYNWLDI